MTLDKMIMTRENNTDVCVNVATNYNCDSDIMSVDKHFSATLSSRDPVVVIEKSTATIIIKDITSEGELI